jgi:hypothetical protein
VNAGEKIATPVTNAAIPATILELLGADSQNNFPASSLVGLMHAGGLQRWPNPLSELARNDIADKEDRAAAKAVPTAITGSMKSLFTPQWQFITHDNMGDQLYDWVRDPAESDNLIHTPETRAASDHLRMELENVTGAKK